MTTRLVLPLHQCVTAYSAQAVTASTPYRETIFYIVTTVTSMSKKFSGEEQFRSLWRVSRKPAVTVVPVVTTGMARAWRQ